MLLLLALILHSLFMHQLVLPKCKLFTNSSVNLIDNSKSMVVDHVEVHVANPHGVPVFIELRIESYQLFSQY